MAEIRWSLRAGRNLREIKDFIESGSPASGYADSFVDRLVASVEILKESPRAGRVVPEARESHRDDIRELIFRGYRVIYSVEVEGVTILLIIHGTRDLRRMIRRGQWNLE